MTSSVGSWDLGLEYASGQADGPKVESIQVRISAALVKRLCISSMLNAFLTFMLDILFAVDLQTFTVSILRKTRNV